MGLLSKSKTRNDDPDDFLSLSDLGNPTHIQHHHNSNHSNATPDTSRHHYAATSQQPSPPHSQLQFSTRRRLLDDMLSAFAAEPAGVIMLVDSFTMRVLSTAFRMSELLDLNIHLVENITMKQDGAYLKRQSLPALPALYFITPSVESVNRLIDDWRDKKRPRYAAAHLYFSSRVSDALVGKIKASAAIAHVRSFREVNLEFVLAESSVFTLNSPDSLVGLFRAEDSAEVARSKMQEQHRVAGSLATVFATMGELPHIRFASAGGNAAAVADVLHKKLDALCRSGCGYPQRILTDDERPTLLVVDRSFDPLTPLLHEYTYQAMVHDLLQVADDRYRFEYRNEQNQPIAKEVLLNETDPLWLRYRHMHIADLSDAVNEELKTFHEEYKATVALSSGSASLKSMNEGLKAMPKFRELRDRFSLHVHLSKQLLDRYNRFGLEKVSMLEQSMACGEDADGRAYRTALADLRDLFRNTDVALSPADRMRLLMIYIITQDGIKPEERRELIELAGIMPEDQVAILNLFYLDVTMLHGFNASKRKKEKGEKKGAYRYEVSRYTPPLRRLAEEALRGTLSDTDYPYERPPGAAGAGGLEGGGGGGQPNPFASPEGGAAKLATWATPLAREGSAKQKKLIVFVVGGITYSEIRELHAVAAETGSEVVIGSTATLPPHRYLIDLKQLKQLE